MAVLTRSQIDATDDRPRETVSVPEWGGDVIVRGLSSIEWDSFDSWLAQQDDVPREIRHRNLTARLVALGLIDESGKRLYSDTEIDLLGQRGSAPLSRLYAVVKRLTGKEAKAKEVIEKNSEPVPSDSSG